MLAEMRALEARKQILEAQLATPEEPRPLIHPNLAEVFRRKVAALNEALADDATRDEAIGLVRSLVESITLTPEEGRLQIDLKGELAGILALCDAGKKKPGAESGTGLLEQVKMVAGTRYPLYRKVLWLHRGRFILQ